MNIYIWKRLNSITNNYHSQAGVVILAASLERAVTLIKEYQLEQHKDWKNKPDFEEICSPDFTCNTLFTEEQVFIFPDAGCC